MSRSDGPHRSFLPIGNPFKLMMPKAPNPPSRILTTFEKNLAERFHQLNPIETHPTHPVTFAWMKSALRSITETLHDIQELIVDLQLPIPSWDIKWVDTYLKNTLNLLDFCSAYGAQVTAHRFSYVILKCALHDITSKNPHESASSLHEWTQYQLRQETPNLPECSNVIRNLLETLDLPTIKNAPKPKPKHKDLVRAMYGLKVQTIFIFSTFISAFSTSPTAPTLFDTRVSKDYLWEPCFSDLQTVVNRAVKNACSSGAVSPLVELWAVDQTVKKVYPLVRDGLGDVEPEVFESYCSELMERNERFLVGLDEFKAELDLFFNVVVSGRTALLDNFQKSPPRSGIQHVRM